MEDNRSDDGEFERVSKAGAEVARDLRVFEPPYREYREGVARRDDICFGTGVADECGPIVTSSCLFRRKLSEDVRASIDGGLGVETEVRGNDGNAFSCCKGTEWLEAKR